jgi:23S rRNA (pseudouridine1915-N3)-methyltransferase
MRIRVLAVGSKMPSWVLAGVGEYQKRLPREWRFEWLELPLGPRSKSQDSARAIQVESDAMLNSLHSQERVIALEVTGKVWSTEHLSVHLADWQMQGQDIAFLIGGPDGLGAACLARADQHWSLSALTLPHPLVRIVLTEQLYRAWTLLTHHPYHK